MRKLELRDDVPLLGYEPEQVPREPQGIGHGRGPTDHGIFSPRGEPTVGQTGSVVRGRDGHDAPDLPAYLVRLLIPEMRNAEKAAGPQELALAGIRIEVPGWSLML